MKDCIFNIVWAAICAWLFTKILIWVDSQYGLSQMTGILQIVNFAHAKGFSIKAIVFFSLVVLFLLTNFHRLFGYVLGHAIIWGIILVIIIAVGVAGWHFLMWLVSSL